MNKVMAGHCITLPGEHVYMFIWMHESDHPPKPRSIPPRRASTALAAATARERVRFHAAPMAAGTGKTTEPGMAPARGEGRDGGAGYNI